MASVASSTRPARQAAAKRASQPSVARLGLSDSALSERNRLRTPSASAAGVASGCEWLGQTSPAFPDEQPLPSEPRSSSLTRTPRRASSYAADTPIAPPPTTTTSGSMS
jgi:hypothetical protein